MFFNEFVNGLAFALFTHRMKLRIKSWFFAHLAKFVGSAFGSSTCDHVLVVKSMVFFRTILRRDDVANVTFPSTIIFFNSNFGAKRFTRVGVIYRRREFVKVVAVSLFCLDSALWTCIIIIHFKKKEKKQMKNI